MLRTLGMLAGIVLLLSGVSAADAAATAKITIGALTFNYDPASWRFERAGDGLVATCVQEDCRGAVVDISRRDDEAACTKEAMAAEAERLFPDAGRFYVNVLRAGRFALVLAERHVGGELSSPEFAYGCVGWQDSEYRFAMRPETVGTQSWIGGALHYLVGTATAPEAVVETVRVGEVEFSVSTEFWHISRAPEGEGVILDCRGPECREAGRSVWLSAHSPARACPLPVDRLDAANGGGTEIERLPAETPDGLAFTLVTTYLGCRNYMPPHLEACTVHGDRSYQLSTMPRLTGCRGSFRQISREELIDLLRGARIVR